MKRILQSLVLMTCAISGMAQAVTKAQLKATIEEKHTPVFGKKRLYQERFKQSDLDSWVDTVNEVAQYVNAADDRGLSHAMSELSKANDKLVNTLKLTYNTLFATKFQGPSNERASIVSDRKKEFQTIEHKVQTVEQHVRKETYKMPSKKDAKDLVLYVSAFIATVAFRAGAEIETELKARGK